MTGMAAMRTAIALRCRYRPYCGRPSRSVQRAAGRMRTGARSLDGDASQPER